jgi:hypothetical protein
VNASAQYSAERDQGGKQQGFHGAMMAQEKRGWQVRSWFSCGHNKTGATLASGAG